MRSRCLPRRVCIELIPGGAHTYARGSDQFPEDMTPILVRGRGARVQDLDGNWFIEYGMGLRSITLGHGYEPVVDAVRTAAAEGVNFSRPSTWELRAAEDFLEQVPGADMVKFAKNGSDVTTAAIKLARAATGRDLVAICGTQPFFSVDDWFIASTQMKAGIPSAYGSLTVKFNYNDLPSLQALFDAYPDQIAAVILEAATATQRACTWLPRGSAITDRTARCGVDLRRDDHRNALVQARCAACVRCHASSVDMGKGDR